jgi:hypothetical protein
MRSRLIVAAAGAVVVAGVLASCDEEAPVVTEAEYLADLDAICSDTTAELAALPLPPEQISVTDFATSAASALTSEAERMRRLDVPTDLDDDHRALVLNTDDQAAAWRQVATDAAAGEEAFGTQRIGELILGRNDLVTEMGADDCVRDGL